MARRTLPVLLAATLVGLLGAADDTGTSGIERRIVSAWNQHRSLRAKVTMVQFDRSGPKEYQQRSEGTLEVLRTGDKTLARVDLKTVSRLPGPASRPTLEEQSTTIVDGQYMYSLIVSSAGPRAAKAAIDPTLCGDPQALLDLLRKDHDVNFVAESNVDGWLAFTFEAKLKEKPPQPGATVRTVCSFDQERGCLLRLIGFDEQGKPTGMMTYADIQCDLDINPDRFKFAAPPGVEVVDHTKQ